VEKKGEPVKLALIPSDGVGKEVVPEARRVLEAVEPHLPFAFSWVPLQAGWETFEQQGTSASIKIASIYF
jgi:homoisocitrate dehydrogenase